MYVGIVLMCVDCVLTSLRIAQANPGPQTPPLRWFCHSWFALTILCSVLSFQHSRFTENYLIMILGDEPLLSQGGSYHGCGVIGFFRSFMIVRYQSAWKLF
jgi:hypothetical protein